MMKKIVSFCILALTLTACYQDKGNYEYTLDSMNEILSVTFSPSVVASVDGDMIEVQQALDEQSRVRRIEAIVEQTLETNLDNLDFYWCRTYIDKQGETMKDTLYTRGYMEVELPVGEAMTYDIFLRIYDRTTELSHYSAFKLTTRPVFKNSLFVLHGVEGKRKLGNIEIIGNETKIYTDVKSVTRDDNHYENVTGLDYTTYYNIPEDLAAMGVSSTLTLYATNNETRAYNPHGMKVKYTADQLLKRETETEAFAYRRTMQTGDPSNYTQYKVVLTDDGSVYVGNHVHALYKPGMGSASNPDHQTDYEITAATITHNRFLLWDAKHGRFLYAAKEDGGFAMDEQASIRTDYVAQNPLLDAHVKLQGRLSVPEEMTAVMGYVNYRDNYDHQNAYFIFRHEPTGEYYRYELRKEDIGDGSKANNRRGAEAEPLAAYTIVSEKHLANLAPTDATTITYNAWFTTSNLFFAEGNIVYRYNVSNGDKFEVYTAPEGYEVSFLKFRTEESCAFSADLGRYLNIALTDGINGAIAEIKFTIAADVDEDYPTLFYDRDNEDRRWGEIKDLQFVNDYMYKPMEY